MYASANLRLIFWDFPPCSNAHISLRARAQVNMRLSCSENTLVNFFSFRGTYDVMTQ